MSTIPFPNERAMQAAIFSNLEELAAYNQLPQNAMLHILAVPNGQWRPGYALEPGILKGAPDILVMFPVNHYAGMALELKMPGKKPRPEQVAVCKSWINVGYYVGWTDDHVDAVDMITSYIAGMHGDLARLAKPWPK